MSILPIRILGDPVLREPCSDVVTFDGHLRALCRDMLDTMYDAPGVGLAAPQVGLSLRLFVYDAEQGAAPGIVANPSLSDLAGELLEEEGCLSIPDFTETVTRPERVKVRYLDRNCDQREMWGEGLMARALCHETDHLNGNLFIDHLRGFKKDRILKKIQKLAKAGMWS